MPLGAGRLKVWDVKTGAIKRDLVGHRHVNKVAFSPDGNLLASAGDWLDGREGGAGAILWNPQSGVKIRTITQKADAATLSGSVAFSPNSKSLVIGSEICDKDINSATYRWVDSSRPTMVSLASVASGIPRWQQTFPHWVNAKGFTPDGKSVAVFWLGQSIRFLDTATGNVNYEIEVADFHPGGQWNTSAIAPQGQMLAIGGVDAEKQNFVDVWSFAASDSSVPPQAQANPLQSETVAATNKPAAAAVQTQPAEPQPNTTNPLFERVHHFPAKDWIGAIACSADGKLIAIANPSPKQSPKTGKWKPSAEILDAETGKTLVSLKLVTDDENTLLDAIKIDTHFEVERDGVFARWKSVGRRDQRWSGKTVQRADRRGDAIAGR